MTAIRTARKKLGLPQTVIAHLARISQPSLSDYERGLYPVPEKVAIRLARALRVDPREIFEKSKERNSR